MADPSRVPVVCVAREPVEFGTGHGRLEVRDPINMNRWPAVVGLEPHRVCAPGETSPRTATPGLFEDAVGHGDPRRGVVVAGDRDDTRTGLV